MATMTIDLTGSGMLAITRDALSALRAALMRDTGQAAAAYLQEAGYAGGGALFEAFRQWLPARGAGGARGFFLHPLPRGAARLFPPAGRGAASGRRRLPPRGPPPAPGRGAR